MCVTRCFNCKTALVLITCAVMFGAFKLYEQTDHLAVSSIASAAPVLVIDAGHGGEDGGAISRSGHAESEINLAIAHKLNLILGLLGEDSVMLRSTDVSLHSSEAHTLREKKVSDLHHRVDMISEIPGALLISIHQNSYPDARYGGSQVFFAPTQGSQAFAEIVQEALRSSLDPENNRRAKQIPDSIYLMNHIQCPAILVECGFLTNLRDEENLLNQRYQTQIAQAIAAGYLSFLCTIT